MLRKRGDTCSNLGSFIHMESIKPDPIETFTKSTKKFFTLYNQKTFYGNKSQKGILKRSEQQ